MTTLDQSEMQACGELVRKKRAAAVGRLTQAELAQRSTCYLQLMAAEGKKWAKDADDVEIDARLISRLERGKFDPFATKLARQRARAIVEQLGIAWKLWLVTAGVAEEEDLEC